MTHLVDQRKRYKMIVDKIHKWNHEYYILNQPTVSDREYDALYKELEALETDFPELKTIESPTQKIGSPPQESFEKFTRKEKMFSLENTYSFEQLKEFYERVQNTLEGDNLEWIVEPKIDGVSIECIFEDGVLSTGATRGDGFIGENVTENVRTIRSIPLRLLESAPGGKVVVRGEIYLERKDLEAINQQRREENLIEFKNPRNAASGSLRLLDSKITASRPLRVAFYSISSEKILIKSHEETFDLLKKWGLPTHKNVKKARSLAELKDICESWKTLHEKLPFDVDGIVIKLNSVPQQRQLGFTSKYPRWAIAFKYETEQAISQILDVSFQVGRTGVLTPVASLEPVFLSGTTVSRASLHNVEEIEKKDIRVGDDVVVEKAGEIIPQVISVLKERRKGKLPKVKIPQKCPSCSSKVGKSNKEDAAIRCLNSVSCPAQIKETLRYFCSRKAFNIEKLGPAIIDQLVEKRLVHNIADLFILTQEQLSSLDRMAEKSAKNILDSIEKAKNDITYPRLLTAFGISHIGETASQVIAKKTLSLDFFWKNSLEKQREILSQTHGIGEKMVDSILYFFQNQKNKETILQLRSLEIWPAMKSGSSQTLAGKSFCVTGKLSKSRDQIKSDIIDAGGDWTSSVTQKLSYLVTNAPSNSSKYSKAKKLNIPIIDENQLYNLIRNPQK